MEWLSGLAFDAVLAPIAGDNPCGIDLRLDTSHDSLYYKIKSLRSQARALERRRAYGETDLESPEGLWRELVTIVPQTLAEKSKDLEITAYLIEALIREHGFAGLHDGFQTVQHLCEQYWDHLYPLPDEDGRFATRMTYLSGLNGVDAEGTLIRPILMCPLTIGETVPACTTATYQRSQSFISLPPEQQAEQLENGGISPEMIATAVKETPTDFLANQHKSISQCLDAFGCMSKTLDEKSGDDSPHTSSIQNALETCQETLQYVAGPAVPDTKIDEATQDAAEELDSVSTEGLPTSAMPVKDGKIHTRADALRVVGEAARFFRQTEPHSPLSYAADQLVRWGQMSLPELLAETIPDPQARAHFFTLMGMPMAADVPEYD